MINYRLFREGDYLVLEGIINQKTLNKPLAIDSTGTIST